MDSLDVVIERLRRVDWKTHTGRQASRVALMQEFLRRSALYSEAYGRADRWPFFDIAASVDPSAADVPLPEDLQVIGLPGRVLQTIGWMLKWAASAPRVAGELPDPYEPLLLFFERGGGFTVENRMVDVDSAGIPIRDRTRYSSAGPFVALDRAELDALDAGATPGPTAAAAALAVEHTPAASAAATTSVAHEGWRALLAAPEGPGQVYATSLSLARRFAIELPPGNRTVLLGNVHEALAAQVVLVGPQAAESFCAAASRLIEAVAAQLGDTPRPGYARAALGLLTLQRIAEACGVMLQLPHFQPLAWPAELIFPELISDEERLLVALLALDSGQRDDARVLLEVVGVKPQHRGARDGLGAWVAALVAALDAEQPGAAVRPLWRELLFVFPSWRAQRKVEWCQLVIAARIVLGTIGGTPPAEVAAELHRQVLALAAPPGAA